SDEEQQLKQLLHQLAMRVEERLQRRELKGKTVQLMIRDKDRKTMTRSKKLPFYIDTKEEIMLVIDELFQLHWNKEPVRLLGVTVQDLLEKQHVVKQLSLFSYEQDEKENRVNETIQQLEKKFGENLFISLDNEEKQAKNKLLRTSYKKEFLYDDKNKKYKVNKTIKQHEKKFRENLFISLDNEEKQAKNKLLRTSFQKDFLDDYKHKK